MSHAHAMPSPAPADPQRDRLMHAGKSRHDAARRTIEYAGKIETVAIGLGIQIEHQPVAGGRYRAQPDHCAAATDVPVEI